jgi:hypothetical protein
VPELGSLCEENRRISAIPIIWCLPDFALRVGDRKVGVSLCKPLSWFLRDRCHTLAALQVKRVMHGDDDQIVPYKDAALLSAKLLKHGTLKIYPCFRTACSRPTPT